MEFCPGGDLYAAIKRGGMSPAEVECCFKQILTGVSYLHSQGVAHRDIKPENFIVTDGWDRGARTRRVVVKLTDFGLSTTDQMSADMDCGSAPYMSYGASFPPPSSPSFPSPFPFPFPLTLGSSP